MVMDAIQNSALEGATASNDFIAGDHALLCYSAPSPGLMTPSAGYTFNWTGYLGGAAGVQMKRFRMEHLESDRVEIQAAYDQEVISSSLGYFFPSVLA